MAKAEAAKAEVTEEEVTVAEELAGSMVEAAKKATAAAESTAPIPSLRARRQS